MAGWGPGAIRGCDCGGDVWLRSQRPMANCPGVGWPAGCDYGGGVWRWGHRGRGRRPVVDGQVASGVYGGGDGDGVLARLRLDIGDTGREGLDCGRGEAKVRWTALRASHASQRTGPRNGWVVAKRTERGSPKRVWIMIGGWLSGLPLGLRVEAMGRCAPAASDRPTRAQCWVGWRKVSSTRQTVWEPKWEHRLPPSVLAERSAGRGGCPKDGGQVT